MLKIRCSQIGKIMSDPKGKSNMQLYVEAKTALEDTKEKYDKLKTKDGKMAQGYLKKIDELVVLLPELEKNKDVVILSDTTKSYLHELKIEEIFGVRKEITSKYMTKGIEQEDQGIQLYLDFKGIDFGIKNEKFYENEFITGTPDLLLEDKVVDVKCPFDCYTMPFFESEIPNKDYYYQLQGYMALTGISKAELAYTLVNTPLDLQYSELDAFDYGNVSIENRIKTYEFEYDQEVVDAIYKRVQECREYYNELEL